MPLAELVPRQRDKNYAVDPPIGLDTCPNSQIVMPRILLQPSEAENLYEAVYHCPRCGRNALDKALERHGTFLAGRRNGWRRRYG